MSNKFIQSGSMYRVLNDEDLQVFDQLPNRTYTVGYNELAGEYFLTVIDDFKLPEKLYGDTLKDADRILNTFMDRANSTGVHLNGIKGAGKTLLAKAVSVVARRELQFPTILVNGQFCGDEFNKFIQSINVPAIVIFDEFEKLYDWEHQDKILTLLDGVYPSKKLFIITSNDTGRISTYLCNRPGRIYYSMSFNSLSPEFVEEYCRDNLKDQSQTDTIVKYIRAYTFFSFDMLAAVVEEMNRYDQTLIEVLQVLNVEPETNKNETYTVTFIVDNNGVEVPIVVSEELKNFDPNSFGFCMDIDNAQKSLAEVEFRLLKELADEYNEITIHKPTFISFEPEENSFTYEMQIVPGQSPAYDDDSPVAVAETQVVTSRTTKHREPVRLLVNVTRNATKFGGYTDFLL